MKSRVSVGGLITALLQGRASLLSVNVANDDDATTKWLIDKVKGKPHTRKPSQHLKVITITLRVSTHEIMAAFKRLTTGQRKVHDSYIDDKDVEDAASLIKTDKNPMPF